MRGEQGEEEGGLWLCGRHWENQTTTSAVSTGDSPLSKISFHSPSHCLARLQWNLMVLRYYKCRPHFPFPVERQLGGFKFLAIINQTAMNIVEHVSLRDGGASFGYRSRGDVARRTEGELFPRKCGTSTQ
jgi:hypothetical protein